MAVGGRLDVIGGLEADGLTTSRVTVVNPADGVSIAARSLARASHDAGGTIVGGRPTVFGGGSAMSQDWIQQRVASGVWNVIGRLPTPRSDLAATSVGTSAYVLGGYNGVLIEPSVLRVARSGRLYSVGRLRVPVRYPAVTVVGGDIWIVGGLSASGPTGVIQRFDVATAHTSVVGRLARPVEGASAVVLGGEIYICGGVVDGSPVRWIFRLDPSTGRVDRAGRLPVPVSYAGAAQLAGAGFLLGGETPAATAEVVKLRLVSATTSMPGRR